MGDRVLFLHPLKKISKLKNFENVAFFSFGTGFRALIPSFLDLFDQNKTAIGTSINSLSIQVD
jgi:hypothetical protein